MTRWSVRYILILLLQISLLTQFLINLLTIQFDVAIRNQSLEIPRRTVHAESGYENPHKVRSDKGPIKSNIRRIAMRCFPSHSLVPSHVSVKELVRPEHDGSEGV